MVTWVLQFAKDYRYVAWYKGWKKLGWCGNRYQEEPKFVELYDYVNDPLETKNMSGHSEYEAIEARMIGLSREHVAYTQESNSERTRIDRWSRVGHFYF